MSKPDRNEISARLRRLPVDFLLALTNATAILVIVAAILTLVVLMRIDNLAERVVTTMTEAVLTDEAIATTRPRRHRHTDEDEGLRFQGWPNATAHS